LDTNHANNSIARIEQQAGRKIYARKRAIIYCRVSTDKQEQDGESLEYQEEKCRQYAELHDIEVIEPVLKEAKSGFIHYAHREKLTFARQMLRDHMADMIIVWDLRRFSRNFVHSAMIFEEIESHGGEIVSVSENIDNSLTGKLIRSILAWSAESEREKIVEYANRRWQTRVELGLPIGTGFAPFGWQWGDKDKTFYVINHEEAIVRFSIFHMFVELDMSIRSISHKLTADGIPNATMSRNPDAEATYWSPGTVHDFLQDKANIGILVLHKRKTVRGSDGLSKRVWNDTPLEVPGGIPAIIPLSLFERAQRKLATNREDKSKLPKDTNEYLLRGHIYCGTCRTKMGTLYNRGRHTYQCRKFYNNYCKCPDLPRIRAKKADAFVWEDCCHLFERQEQIQQKIEELLQSTLAEFLEDTNGKDQVAMLTEAIAHAKEKRAEYAEGTYLHTLITEDIQKKTEELRRFEEEQVKAVSVAVTFDGYKARLLEFRNFLNTMKGKYHKATFQEKRNALDVLGVKVYIHLVDKDVSEKRIEVVYSPTFTGVNPCLDGRYIAER
jgi:site-specific DNA recombinase